MEDEQDWYFTFGFNQGYDNCYAVIRGTRDSARTMMNVRFGYNWAFQYKSAKEAGVEQFNLLRIA